MIIFAPENLENNLFSMRRLLDLLFILPLCYTASAQQLFQFHHINTKGNVVKAVYGDANGIIWLGTTSGLYSLPQLESRLPNSYRRGFPNVNASITSISGTKDGRLLLKTHFNQFFIYDPRCNEFIPSGHSDTQMSQGVIWQPPVTLPSPATGSAEDSEGRIWVSTQSTGVFIFDKEGRQLNHLQHQIWNRNSLESDHVDMIHYEPDTKTMWLAYAKGGLSVCESGQDNDLLNNILDYEHHEAETDVLTFAPIAGRKGMWVGLEKRGIYQFADGKVSHVLDNGYVTALYSDNDGSLWAGLYLDGLIHRTVDGKVTKYFNGSSPFAIAKDGEGHIYVALLGKGVWWLDPLRGDTLNTHLVAMYVSALKYHHQKLYAASTEGFYKYDGTAAWEKVCDGNFRSFLIDQKDYIWLLGGEGSEGLTLLAPNGEKTEVPNGLEHAPLKNMTADADGNVWIATPTELLMLCHYQGEEGKLDYYSFNINASDQKIFYNPQASITDPDGSLWLGTTKGYQRVDTKRLISQTTQVAAIKRLVVGAISINNNVLSPGQVYNNRILLDKDVVLVRELDLKYNENDLEIECSQPYYEGFTTDVFYYQVKGLSDVWYPMKDMTILLSSLPPGYYEVLTRTQSSRQSLLLAIHIAPPFWLSWWAWLIYLLLTVIAVYFLVRYFRNKQAYKTHLREMKLKQEQQEQMNEMKQRFFTNISHDLRTPLSLIITPVEELLKRKDLGEKRENLEIVHRNAEHLLSLVNQILDFRRLELGHEQLHLSYGDIVMLEWNVCEMFRLKAVKEEILLDFVPDEEKIETLFDRDKMTKVLMNLLSNAFKFTSAGGCVKVRVERADGVVVTTVTDTGVGIPDKDKSHIFERFYQSESGTRASMGSGIGLHIVREYIQLQGGDIIVSDNPDGAGTEFRFTIPLRKPEDISEASKQSALPLLLIVDDNSDMLTYMSKGLSSDYGVITATNGVDALQQLEDQDVDIIISDVMMPEMDGLELCRRIKTNIETSHVPVVLLTAKSLTSDELEGLEAGADDYITKPFSMDILRQRVHKLLERSRSQHERFAKEIDIEPSEITITSLDEKFIAKAIGIVEAHISESEFGVEELSSEMGVHRAQLYKKLEHLTGKSPQQFIRILRLKRGKQLLEQSGLYISEVAYQVGFNSPRIFSKYFKEEFGVTPKKYSK